MIDLPRAMIWDIDGTLMLRDESRPDCRRFYDWHRVGEDIPNEPVVELMRLVSLGDPSIFHILFSGRDDVCRPETEASLRKHDIGWHELHMRRHKDNRKDSIVKREMYETYIVGRYRVLFVVDDRAQVVSMWRHELGLTVFQCADGNF